MKIEIAIRKVEQTGICVTENKSIGFPEQVVTICVNSGEIGSNRVSKWNTSIVNINHIPKDLTKYIINVMLKPWNITL